LQTARFPPTRYKSNNSMQDKQYVETLQRTSTFKAPTPAYTIHKFVMHNDGKVCRSLFCLEEQRLKRSHDTKTVATTCRRAYPKNRTTCSSTAASTKGASAALILGAPPSPGIRMYTAGFVTASAKNACKSTEESERDRYGGSSRCASACHQWRPGPVTALVL
jgi:hypothetical protein